MQTDSNKPRVFVVHINGQDFSKAEAFGVLVPLLEGPVSPFMPERIRVAVEEKLNSFTPDDYLLLSGNALGCAFAWEAAVEALLVDRSHATVRLLIFDAKKREYFVRTLDV